MWPPVCIVKYNYLIFFASYLFQHFVFTYLTDETGLASYLYKVLTASKYNSSLTKGQLKSTAVLEETILELFGKTWGNKQKLHTILSKMDQDHNGSVSEMEFVQNCLKNKSLLFPVIRYQLDLRGRILSHPFWTKREGLSNQLLPDLVRTRDKLHTLSLSSSSSSVPTEVAEAQSSSLSSAMAHSVKHTEDNRDKGHEHDGRSS